MLTVQINCFLYWMSCFRHPFILSNVSPLFTHLHRYDNCDFIITQFSVIFHTYWYVNISVRQKPKIEEFIITINMYISLKLFSLWLNICLNHPFMAYLEWIIPIRFTLLCVKDIWEWFFLSTFKHSFNTYHECIYAIKRFPFGPIVKL